MAITRAQQAKQMLQNGGMSLQDAKDMAPKGEFLAYINRKEADMLKKAGGSGIMTKAGIPSFTADTGPGGGATDTGPGHTGDSISGDDPGGTQKSRRPDRVSKPPPPPAYDEFGPPSKRNFGFMNEARRRVNPLGRLTEVPGIIGFTARAITPNPFGFGPPDIGFDDPVRGGKGDIPLWMQLGYSSEEEYNAAMGRGAAPAVTEDPPVDLNRVAYRLMADGGAVMDDEPRQAYGLGSIVKKATRAIKKVAKSDIGKLALLYAGTAGLASLGAGGGFGSLFQLGTYAPSAVGANIATSFGRLKGASLFKNAAVKDLGIRGGYNMANIAGPKTGMSLGAKAALGIGAVSALPLLGIGVEEDEEEDKALDPYLGEGLDIAAIRANPRKFQGQAYRLMSEGGSTEEKEPVAKKVMPLIDMDGKEKDYRETGGFVDMGRMEKADDVPARLSKNEFVFTADAVRNAGDGSVDKGAEVMYNMMKNLEAGGEVSEESQGLEGARKMFQTSQRLEEVL